MIAKFTGRKGLTITLTLAHSEAIMIRNALLHYSEHMADASAFMANQADVLGSALGRVINGKPEEATAKPEVHR